MTFALRLLAAGFLLLSACAKAPKTLRQPSPPPDSYFYLLRSNLKAFEGNLESSLEDLNRALSAYPEDVFLKYLAAERHAKLNELEKAHALMEEVLEVRPDWYDAEMLFAQILEAEGKFEAAGRIFSRLTQQKPGEEQGYFALAQNRVHREKYNEAIAILRRWQEKKPDSITTLFTIATIQNVYLKNEPAALQTYQAILKLDPDSARVRSQMAQIYLKQDNKEKALEELLFIERLFPDDFSVKLQIAFIYQETHRIEKAIDKLQEMAVINPQADRVHYYLGLLYERDRQDEKALNAFEKIPAASSLYKDAVLHRVALLREAKKEEDAIRILKTAMGKKPEVVPFYQLLSALYEDRRETKAAVDVLKTGIRKNPKDEDLYFNLGALFDRLKNRSESIAMMRKVLEINPENASALNYIGYTCAEAGENLEEALAMIQKALALKPGDGYILDSLGWAYFRMGEIEKARQNIQAALKILPEEPVIVEHMGDIFLKLGKTGPAKKYFRRALELGKKREKPNAEEIGRVEGKLKALGG